MPTKRFNERQKQRCMAVWIGGIFLKDEGGYEIVLRSLAHYKKRLRTISESPELKEAAAMFAPILVSQAQKRYPMVIEVQKKIEQMLQNSIKCYKEKFEEKMMKNGIPNNISAFDQHISLPSPSTVS